MEEYKKQKEIYNKQLDDLYNKKSQILKEIIEILDNIEELKKKYNIYDDIEEDIFENITPAQIDIPENNDKQISKRGRKGKKIQDEDETSKEDNISKNEQENNDENNDDNEENDDNNDDENNDDEENNEKIITKKNIEKKTNKKTISKKQPIKNQVKQTRTKTQTKTQPKTQLKGRNKKIEEENDE